MKKILFIINNLGIGGAERVFVDDANYLSSIGYDVTFVILYGDVKINPLLAELKMSNDKITLLKAKSIYDFHLYRKLYDILKKNKNNIVYATLNDAVFVSRTVCMFFLNVFLVTREANITNNKSLALKLADILMNFRVNVMVAVSEEVKKSISFYQPWSARKVKILHNGVDIPETSVKNLDNKVVLTVGSLTPKKAHTVLIDAFLVVIKEITDAKLYIIGEGVLRKSLERQIIEGGMKEHVFLLGEKKYKDVVEHYKTSSMFVLPSNQEGCPNVLLEAMSFGLPSVATDTDAVSEIIENGVSGIIVPTKNSGVLADNIIKVLNNADLRYRIGKNGKDRIVFFSKETHRLKLIKILINEEVV